MIILAGSRGISDVHITGPSVLENGRQQWVDLTCSFTFTSAEYKQLDIKWYFDNEVRRERVGPCLTLYVGSKVLPGV